MGTEVLRPYDVLVDRFPASFHRRRQIQGGNKKGSGKKIGSSPENGATKKARNGSGGRKDDGTADGGLVSGKVTLLRRGESLDSLAKILRRSPDPEPEPVAAATPVKILTPRNQIRLSPAPFRDVYAGSAFYSSPSPRSLPLPSFFNKRDPADSATQDLRRMLRLD